MLCGTAMASIAIESFSPRRLVECAPGEIASRVQELHQMIYLELKPIWG
jgi:hypothetical protein